VLEVELEVDEVEVVGVAVVEVDELVEDVDVVVRYNGSSLGSLSDQLSYA